MFFFRLPQEEEDEVRGKVEAARAAQHKAEQLQTQLEADGSRLQRAQQALEAERAKLQVGPPPRLRCAKQEEWDKGEEEGRGGRKADVGGGGVRPHSVLLKG